MLRKFFPFHRKHSHPLHLVVGLLPDASDIALAAAEANIPIPIAAPITIIPAPNGAKAAPGLAAKTVDIQIKLSVVILNNDILSPYYLMICVNCHPNKNA